MFVCGLIASCTAHNFVSPFAVWEMEGATIVSPPTASITVQPTVLKGWSEWVSVAFTVQNPQPDDRIALFSPSTVDFNSTSPIKYQYATASPGYLTTGQGKLTFKVLNMHADCVFALLRNTTAPAVLGVSNTITFANLFEPMQGHIALTENPGEIRVSWANSATAPPQFLQWGFSSGHYIHRAPSTYTTYTASDLCGEPATTFGWRDPGLLHTYVITGLTVGQRVYYVYGNDNNWSAEASFWAPKPASPVHEVRIVAYGDMGKGEEDGSEEHWEERPSLNTTRNVLALVDETDLVLHIGDIAYAVGYSSQWDEFMAQILPIASRLPYMTGIGNHERDFPDTGSLFNGTDCGGECGVPYESRFIMPRNANQTRDQPWYSFEYGPVHVTVMSTEHDFNVSSPQYDFLASDLAGVDRTRTPWLIFAGHRPMYIDSNNTEGDAGDQPVAEVLRENVEPLLYKMKVDLALWGHHHSYQRTCPVFQQQCVQSNGGYTAPVHVVIGMAGMGLSQNLVTPAPAWIHYVDDQEYGYTTLFANSTSLHMRYFSNTAGLRDDFWLSKP